MRKFWVQSFEIVLRNGYEVVWVMPDPIRFALEPEEALRTAQVFMDALRSDARDAGIPVGVGFKNVQKVGKVW